MLDSRQNVLRFHSVAILNSNGRPPFGPFDKISTLQNYFETAKCIACKICNIVGH